MKIITLGTGNAFTSDGRANTSVLLDGTFKVLFDCSPQTISSLRKLNLAPNQIDYIFISHLHGDHSGGLPFFLLNLKHRESGTVTVSGPPGLEKQIHTVYKEYFGDVDINKYFKFQQPTSKYPFDFEYMEGDHSILDFIYKIELDNKKIVYTGDTRPIDLSKFANNAEELIDEIYSIFPNTLMPNDLDIIE